MVGGATFCLKYLGSNIFIALKFRVLVRYRKTQNYVFRLNVLVYSRHRQSTVQNNDQDVKFNN